MNIIHINGTPIRVPEGISPYDLLRGIASEFDIPVKIWSPADLDEYVVWYPAEHREALRESAQVTHSWGMLEDCTETDWTYVQNAVETAADEMGLEALPDGVSPEDVGEPPINISEFYRNR